MRNAGLEEAQAGIKISRRNINNLRSADDICRSYNSSAQKSPFALSKSLRMKATVFTITHKALHNLFPIISLWTHCMTSLLFFHFFRLLGTFSAQGLCTCWSLCLDCFAWFFAWFTLSTFSDFFFKVTVTLLMRLSENHFIKNSFIFLLSTNLYNVLYNLAN